MSITWSLAKHRFRILKVLNRFGTFLSINERLSRMQSSLTDSVFEEGRVIQIRHVNSDAVLQDQG